MKKITLAPLTICLILVMVPGISASLLADIASETNTKAEQHFEKANELLKRADYAAAIAEYERVTTLSSGSKIAQDAQYWIGQTHFRAGKFDAAQATFAKLIEQYPASAIVPVTKLMVERVRQAKENEEIRRTMNNAADKGFIIDPDTGVKYTKTMTFVGKRDVIEWTPHTHLSPNGRFLLQGNTVVPMDGSDPFELVDSQVQSPSWSPDGKKIAFISNDSTISIVRVSPETGHATGSVRKLLSGDYNDLEDISWSPNGGNIVFRICDNKKHPDIWTLSVEDGSLTKITNDSIPQLDPAWSPDGTTIAYRQPFGSIWLCPAEGGIPRKFIDNTRGGLHWSPDGKWLFFNSQTFSAWTSLDFIRLADKMELTINPPEKVGGYLSWSPDGKKMLFFYPSYDIIWGMKVASASGGPSFEPVQYLPVYGARWNLDSKMIVIQGEDNKGDIAMRIVPLAGGESFLLDMDVSVDGKPFPYCVSPDLKKLLFNVVKDDKTDLYVVSISVKDARTTAPAVRVIEGWSRRGGFNANLSWSPDGSKLALIHKEDIWISNVNGEKPMQITKTPETECWPAWSANGKMLNYKIYFDKSDWKTEHRIIPSQGGNPIKIFKDCEDFRWSWSPDSKAFAMVSNAMISISPFDGRDTRQILDLKRQGLDDAYELCWSPDGKYLAFMGESKKGNNNDTEYQLFRISVEDGGITKLATDDTDYKYSISWSPDGKWMCYLYEKMGKVRPEGTMWEADFEEIVKKSLD